MEVMPKFELLPNEILIECFEYLNASDIFYSFDQLNYRFYHLIRTIPLYLNFQSIRKFIFDQFCMKMLSNPQIRNEIYSLELSNKDTCGQIQAFLSFFSLNDFSHLRSLTLIQIEENNLEKLQSMLPFIPQLRCLRIIHSDYLEQKILRIAPVSQLKTLEVSSRFSYSMSINQILSINNLTLSYCHLDTLCELFKYLPMLKYLDAGKINGYAKLCFTSNHAGQLKTLIVRDFSGKFEDIEIFVKHMTPNLKVLVMIIDNRRSSWNDIIDADRWERLITSSLLQLIDFKFQFTFSHVQNDGDILKKFKEFQNHFWHEQHHWYTEYSLSKYSAIIYTIPYLSNTYTLIPYTHKYSNTSIDNSHIFDNVRELRLHRPLTHESSFYFSNVTSLILYDQVDFETVVDHFLKSEDIESLKMIINLSNLKHLTISSIEIGTTTVLLQLLKQAKQLSSMKIDLDILQLLFTDYESCLYLNKMIKKLDIWNDYKLCCINSEQIEQFCQVFSNLEQLKCMIEGDHDIPILLTRLSKLSTMKARIQSKNWWRVRGLFENVKWKLNIISDFKNKLDLEVWISRNIN